MATALNVIKSAMRKAGILTKTESPSADEAVDALETLNALLDSWANDSLTAPYRTSENFPLTSGKGTYTITPGGDFDTACPISIISAYVRDAGTDTLLTPISDEEYAAISDKALTGTPEKLNFMLGQAAGVIKLHPVPNTACSLFLLTEKPLGALTLHQTIILPPGWRRAIDNTLATELAPEYGVSIPQEVAVTAKSALDNLKKAAAKNKSLDVDGAIFSLGAS